MDIKKITSALKLLMIYVLTGIVSGVIGALFSKGVSFVTNIRHDNSWLLFLLPVAGVVTVAVYKFLNVAGVGTNQVIQSADGKNGLSFKLVPAVFSVPFYHTCAVLR